MFKSIAFSLLGLAQIYALPVRAQLEDLPTLHDTLYSAILKEKRPLEIVLPASYKPGESEQYDVLYTTDGEYTTKIVSSFAQFLSIQFIKENIVVSIPNTSTGEQRHRERDMLPTHAEGVPESGGAANFLAFIKEELMPYINRKYRVSGVNTLYGSSYAGVFTMFAFLKEPQLFQTYLLADPAFHWDHQYMITLAKQMLPSLPVTHTSLLITGREGDPLQYMGVASIDSVLREKAPAGLRWKVNVYSDETHNSMIFRTVYDGLKFTYAGYSTDPVNFYPANGIVLKDRPLKVICGSELKRDLHYTTDGTEPSSSSPTVDSGRILLTGPGTLAIKAVCNLEKYSQKSVTGIFKAGESLPSSPKPKNALSGSWSYSYYEGSWDSLPAFQKIKPAKTGLTDSSFALDKLPRQNNFACVQEGWLEIKEDGYYLFGLNCSGGARLILDRQKVIDYNGLHKNGRFQTYTLPLLKGFYPFRLEYFLKEGKPDLQFVYIAPGKNDADPIAADLQYHSRNAR